MDDTQNQNPAVDEQAENPVAPYNDSEAGNSPEPTEPTGADIEGSGEEVSAPVESPEQQAETEGEEVNNPQPEVEAPATETDGEEAEPEEPVATEEVEQTESTDEGATQDEKDEFARLKTKRHNMPLTPEDIDRYDTLNKKING